MQSANAIQTARREGSPCTTCSPVLSESAVVDGLADSDTCAAVAASVTTSDVTSIGPPDTDTSAAAAAAPAPAGDAVGEQDVEINTQKDISATLHQPSQLALLLADEARLWAQNRKSKQRSSKLGEVLSLLHRSLNELLTGQRMQMQDATAAIAQTQHSQSDIEQQQEDALKWVVAMVRQESTDTADSNLGSQRALRLFGCANASDADNQTNEAGACNSAMQGAIEAFSHSIKAAAQQQLQRVSSQLVNQRSAETRLIEQHRQQLELFHSKAIADVAALLHKDTWIEDRPPCPDSRDSCLSHLLYGTLVSWNGIGDRVDSDGGGALNLPVLLAQTLAKHGGDQERLLQEHGVQYAQQSRAIQAAKMAVQAAQAEKVALARLLKHNLMPVAEPVTTENAAGIGTNVAYSDTSAAATRQAACAEKQVHTSDQPTCAASDNNNSESSSSTNGRPVVMSEELLRTSIIAPFEEAADTKIAVKQADLDVQLQNGVKLSATHATALEKYAQGSIGAYI